MWVTCYGNHVGMNMQHYEISSLLPPLHMFWELHLGRQAWAEAPSPIELSQQPLIHDVSPLLSSRLLRYLFENQYLSCPALH